MTSIVGATAAFTCVLLAAVPARAAGNGLLDPLEPVATLTIAAIDPDAVARMKLEAARALLTKRDFDGAGKAVLEVIRLAGVPEKRRAEAFTVACDLGMRTKDWELAKTMCEKALSIREVSKDDRAWSTATLKTLRKEFPDLFK